MNHTSAQEETIFIDCLTCNEIKEEPAFPDAFACAECGDQLFVSN